MEIFNIICQLVLGGLVGYSFVSIIFINKELKQIREFSSTITDTLERADAKVRALEAYFGIKFIAESKKLSFPPIEISKSSPLIGCKMGGEAKVETTPAHYEHVKVEESKKIFFDAIKDEKAKAKSEKLKKAWKIRKAKLKNK